jgi:hypothetical protein
MQSVATAVDDSLHFILAIGDVVLTYLVWAELYIRQQMNVVGAPPIVQTAVLVCIGAIATLASTRLLGGAIRVGVFMVLVLSLARVALPVGVP